MKCWAITLFLVAAMACHAQSTEQLDSLVALYSKFHMPPLPVGNPVYLRPKGYEGWHYIGFLQEGKEDYAVGTHRLGPLNRYEAISFTADNAPTPFVSAGIGLFQEDPSFLAALALATRKQYDLARLALRLVVKTEPYQPSHAYPFELPPGPSESLLAAIAFNHHTGRLQDSNVPMQEVLEELEAILASGLLPKEEPVRRAREEFVRDLRMSSLPNTATTNTIEWQFNDLVHATSNLSRFGGTQDERYYKLFKHGLPIIPEAIAHLGDLRITRSVHGGGGPARPVMMRIDDFAYMLLIAYTGGHIKEGRQEKLTREQAQNWWDKVKDLSEEEYLRRFAISPPGDWTVNSTTLIDFVRLKYPRLLLELLPRSQVEYGYSYAPIADALVEADLPKKEKLDALTLAIRKSVHTNRVLAVPALLKLSKPDAEREFLSFCIEVSGEPTELMGVAALFESKTVWQELTRTISAAPVATRLSLVDRTYVPLDKESNKPANPRLIEFLAHFLKDGEYIEESYGKPRGSVGIRAYSVRQIAAMKLGPALKVVPVPDPSAPAAEVEAYALRVDQALLRSALNG